jgi:hypothetical protein
VGILLKDNEAIKARNREINPEIVSGSQKWNVLHGKKK